jgi:two-component system, NtrC family, sensor histidine kinase KinB
MSISESQRLETLYRIARQLHDQDLNMQAILQTVLSMTGEAIQAKHGCMITFNDDGDTGDAYILGSSENGEAERKLWNLLISQGLIGFVHHGQRTIIVRDLRTDPRWPQLPDTTLIPGTGSAIGLPLEKNGRLHGVLILLHPAIDYFDGDLVNMLEAVANIASAAVGNAAEFSSAHAVKQRYQWLFNDSIVPIILTDLRGNVIDANRQACIFLKYELQKLRQVDITTIHRMGTGPLGTNRFESLQMGREIEFRTTAWAYDGRDIPVSVRARRLSFGDQDVIEWIEQDISAQLELEQLRADLSAMVYHDLRGPLQNIHSSLSMLGRLLANAPNKAIIDMIQVGIRSSRQLSRMVESLLDIQRLEEGRTVLDRKSTSLHSLLANAAELVQPLAAEANQRLSFNLNTELPFLKIDSDMILRVVTNLIENAVKYTPTGGTIKLSADIAGNSVRISISDSGPGIPPHMQRQIFDKFSRVKYHDVPKGVGLGLAFCRLAVEAHGGRIWVESEPGKGSNFLFSLPLDVKLEQAAV